MTIKKTNGDVTERAIKWLNSPTGKEKLKNAYKRAKTATESLNMARRVNPESLERPITK